MTPGTKRSARTARAHIDVEPQRRRIGVFLGTILILVAALAIALAVWGRDNPLTAKAQDYAETVATTSAATYVTLRTLNAFLSTAQEVEISGGFVVGGSAQPLKVLEPIDDTVERIAGAIFVVMIATGVLAVALGPVGGIGLAMVALACLAALATQRGIARNLAGYGLFLAIALPLTFVLSALVADTMTASVWTEHQAIIDDITRGVSSVSEAEDTAETGWLDVLGSLDDYRAFAASIYANADRLVGSFVMILAVFVFKIFVLPALLLGGFFVTVRAMVRG